MAVRSLSLETTVVDIDGSLGEHEEEFLVVEKHDQLGVKALGRSQIHDSILKHLSMGRFRLGYAVNHEAMISLLDENVLFEDFEKLHFVCAVKEEVGSVDDLARVQSDHRDRHHEQAACGNGAGFLSHQNHPLSIAQPSEIASTPHALPGSFRRGWSTGRNNHAASTLCIRCVSQEWCFYCFEAQKVMMISLYSSNSK